MPLPGLESPAVPMTSPFHTLMQIQVEVPGIPAHSLVMTFASGLPVPPGPSIRDGPATMTRLAQKWDDLDLLMVHREDIPLDSLVRIFGALKSSEVHRQIGDKRGRNAMECKVPGPSSDLPSGVDLCDLYIDPSRSSLLLSITDRRDFYHQLKITQQKAIANTISPAIPQELLRDTKAFSAFILGSTGKRYDRVRQADCLERDAPFRSSASYPRAPLKDSECWISFGSILHKDHIRLKSSPFLVGQCWPPW